MAKDKQNEELLRLMEDYNLFMESPKHIDRSNHNLSPKSNHSSSLCLGGIVTSANSFGNTVFECEIKDPQNQKFSIQLMTDKISSKVLFRLDEGGGTHRNNLPNIPLCDQIVPTPHFHKYNDQGYFYAFQSKELKDRETPLNFIEGFDLFSEVIYAKILNKGLIMSPVEGFIQFPDEDPLNGIVF